MISKFNYKNLTWIDMEKPSKDEILHLMEKYPIPPLVGEELLDETMRSKADLYEKQEIIYLVLHFPALDTKTGGYKDQEIDFILGKDFIITTHYETIDPLYEFSKVFEVDSILDKGNIGDHAGFLFLYMVRELYKNSNDQLGIIYKDLRKIEESVFVGKESRMVEPISILNRKLLNFGRAIHFHQSILLSFETASVEIYGQKFIKHLPGIISEYHKIQNTIDAHREFLKDIRDTNDSLLSTRTNERMKMLTVLTFSMLPITLITGIFGMNTNSDLVLIRSPKDFGLVLIGMLVIGLIMFLYFKGKKWL